MAQMYNINALSYTSKENPEWFTRAMFGGRLISSGIIRVLTGIKGEELLSMIDLENKVLQIDGLDCAWTPNQIIKLSEKRAKVSTYKINLEECIDTLENKRTVYALSPGAQNDELPSDLEAATLHLIAVGLSNEIEEMIIGGDASVDPNQFNGMVKTLVASTDAAHIVGATLTSSNVLPAIEAIYAAFDEDVLQAEDAGTLYIFGSYATRRVLRKAVSALPSDQFVLSSDYTIDKTDPKNPRIWYLGVEFIPVKGIDNATLIGIDAGTNAFILTDMTGDLENVELGQFPKPNDNKVFIRGRLRLGFIIPFEDEAVLWGGGVTAAQTAGDDRSAIKVIPNSLVFKAAGETKTATVFTKDTAAVLATLSANPVGFTVTKGSTTAGVTTITVVAAANTGSRDPRVGEVDVAILDANRGVTLTLNQASEDVDLTTN